jgi:hypothetical protein
LPSGVTATPWGKLPMPVIVAVTLSVAASMTDTLPSAAFVT